MHFISCEYLCTLKLILLTPKMNGRDRDLLLKSHGRLRHHDCSLLAQQQNNDKRRHVRLATSIVPDTKKFS